MRRRRALLSAIATVLLVADGAFLLWCWHVDTAPNAWITRVGIDSAVFFVPTSAPAPVLRDGQWYIGGQAVPDPRDAQEKGVDRGGAVLVSLGPSPTFGQGLRSIRDLKARGICNLMIREDATPVDISPGTKPQIAVPALVLCGHRPGDAGFSGKLPPDGPIHVDW